MNNWNVEPLKDINGIRFGMLREEVRKIMACQFKEFKKSNFSKNTADDFDNCHIFYDADDRCEAVEIFDEITVSIKGEVIFPTELVRARNIITDFENEDGSYISKSWSVGIYAPFDKMESILFGCKGYYE